jgi:hypothetical protein
MSEKQNPKANPEIQMAIKSYLNPTRDKTKGYQSMTPRLGDDGAGGTFKPASVELTATSPSAKFTYTPKKGGDQTAQPQAQHSALPWTYSAIGGDNFVMSKGKAIAEVLFDENGEWEKSIKEMDANARLIVASVNHAEKLAEALRDIQKTAFRHEVQYWLNDPRTDRQCLDAIVSATREALAAWDKAQ